MNERIVILMFLGLLNSILLTAQDNIFLIECPINNNKETDSEEFNKIIKNKERAYENLLIVRFGNTNSTKKEKYLEFARNHENWCFIFFVWKSPASKEDFTFISESEKTISGAHLIFSISRSLNCDKINDKTSDGVIEDVSRKNASSRFYYELSKDTSKYSCVTGELLDFLYLDVEKVIDEVEDPSMVVNDQLLLLNKKVESIAMSVDSLLNMNKRNQQIAKEKESSKTRDKQNQTKKISIELGNLCLVNQFSNNYSSNSASIYWSKMVNSDIQRKWNFGLGLGIQNGNFFYNNYADLISNRFQDREISIHNLSEFGNVKISTAKATLLFKRKVFSEFLPVSSFSRNDYFWISGNVCFGANSVYSSNYQWTSGTMDIRGKVDGIGDEIINVPDMGYRDGISLVGLQGQSNIKRFFPSASIDAAFHYNLEKVDFFTGVGYTISSKLKPVNPDALVSDGTHFNSLISTTNPIAIRTPYFSFGASLNF